MRRRIYMLTALAVAVLLLAGCAMTGRIENDGLAYVFNFYRIEE